VVAPSVFRDDYKLFGLIRAAPASASPYHRIANPSPHTCEPVSQSDYTTFHGRGIFRAQTVRPKARLRLHFAVSARKNLHSGRASPGSVGEFQKVGKERNIIGLDGGARRNRTGDLFCDALSFSIYISMSYKD
jgi:hypothetical protein